MKSLPETLPDETNALQKMVLDYQSTVDQLQEKLKWYEEQFCLFQHQRFGASSEKCPDQMELFNEAESILALSAPDGMIVSRRRREICQSEVRDSAREAKFLSRIAVEPFVVAMTELLCAQSVADAGRLEHLLFAA